METKKTSGVQIIKGSSGDIMLIVPIDKETAKDLMDKDIAVAVAEEKHIGKIICGARYDNFRLREELILPAVAGIRR